MPEARGPAPAPRRGPAETGRGPEWGVEGAPPPEKPAAARGRFPRMPGGSRFWWILLGLLALNCARGASTGG